MRLAELIENLPVSVAQGPREPHEPHAPLLDVTVRAVVEDSRRVEAGALFVARGGRATDGRRYITDAIARGAVAVLTDPSTPVDDERVACLHATDVTRAAATIAERFHGDPSRRLELVGITGTNGKTTVAMILQHLLAHAGVRCGFMGTVGVDLGAPGSTLDDSSNLTTPPSVEISRLLALMVADGCRVCVMETSSHALDQDRTAGLRFAGGVFTNLSGDHLDYHGTEAAYRAAKMRLFESLPADGWAVINVDDAAAAHMIGACGGAVVRTTLTDRVAECFSRADALAMDGTRCILSGPWGSFEVVLPLIGAYNVSNALQAVAAAHRLGVAADTLRDGLTSCGAPAGRLEAVAGPDDDVTVLVDYAHTDDALENVLHALRPVVPAGCRLRVVFGCGGDRDRAKRPRMAEAAWRWADDVVITSDNPRMEDPLGIIDEIAGGVPPTRRRRTRRLVDREEAIHAAIAAAGAGDVVLVAGKGHETYQIVGVERRAFDDRVIAREALAARRGVGVTAGRARGVTGDA